MEEYMPGIKHIVYLMLENRSLDNVLGWLYEGADQPQNFIPPSSASIPYDGLKPNTSKNYNDLQKKWVFASQIAPGEGQSNPDPDPNEPYLSVKDQIAEYMGEKMGGFIKDYNTTKTTDANSIMKSYSPDSLPVLNTLAKAFAVSDAYYCSVPSNTDANRAFSLTGNSIGTYDYQEDTAMVDTAVYYKLGIPPYPFSRRCLWDVLSESGLTKTTDWMVFYHQTWPGPNVPIDHGNQCFTQLMIDSLQNYDKKYFNTIDQFYRILNGAEFTELPTFSYLEPCWCLDPRISQNGNDYHPPANLACGEAFLKQLFEKLQNSKYWENTLLVINFDEHGGTYDHVEPTAVVKAPWDDPNDGTAKPAHFVIPESEFDFQRLGVRVPLLLISPRIEANTVIRSDTDVPFDHTSVIATILNYFKIPIDKWNLGSRTRNAPTFEKVITTLQNRAPVVVPPAKSCNPNITLNAAAEAEAQELPLSIMARSLARKAKEHNHPDENLRALFKEHLSDVNTISQMHESAKHIMDKIAPKTEY